MNEVSYTPEAPDNPNFVSRPPDPGFINLYRTVGWDALYHSPFSGVYRMTQLGLESSNFMDDGGALLKPEDANKKYGLDGQLTFDEPVREHAAQIMMQRKIDENDRNYVIGSGMNSGYRQAAGIGVGMAATLLDPINFASMFVPVVGEARFARMVTRFGGSVTKARLAAGAIQGVAGTAMVEPFILLPAMQEHADYGLMDSAANLGYGAVLGAFLHAGFGAIGDRMKKLQPRESDAMFESAMNNVLKDEPVTAPAKLSEFTENGYFYHLDSTNAPIESFKSKGILPSKDAYQGPGVYMAEKPEMTEVNGTLSDGTLYRINKQALIDKFGVYSDKNPTGVQLGEPNEVLLGGDRSVPPEFIDVKQGDQWIPLAEQRSVNLPDKLNDLHDQINNDQIRADTESRIQEQDLVIDKETKTDIPRLTEEDMKSPTETPKVLSSIEKEATELEASLNLDEGAKSRFEEQMKTQIGDPKLRETGVKTAIDCIIRNLI